MNKLIILIVNIITGWAFAVRQTAYAHFKARFFNIKLNFASLSIIYFIFGCTAATNFFKLSNKEESDSNSNSSRKRIVPQDESLLQVQNPNYRQLNHDNLRGCNPNKKAFNKRASNKKAYNKKHAKEEHNNVKDYGFPATFFYLFTIFILECIVIFQYVASFFNILIYPSLTFYQAFTSFYFEGFFIALALFGFLFIFCYKKFACHRIFYYLGPIFIFSAIIYSIILGLSYMPIVNAYLYFIPPLYLIICLLVAFLWHRLILNSDKNTLLKLPLNMWDVILPTYSLGLFILSGVLFYLNHNCLMSLSAVVFLSIGMVSLYFYYCYCHYRKLLSNSDKISSVPLSEPSVKHALKQGCC